MDKAIREEKERIKQAEYRTLNKIKPLPKGLLLEHQDKIAGYTSIDKNHLSTKKVSTVQKIDDEW